MNGRAPREVSPFKRRMTKIGLPWWSQRDDNILFAQFGIIPAGGGPMRQAALLGPLLELKLEMWVLGPRDATRTGEDPFLAQDYESEQRLALGRAELNKIILHKD